MFEFANLFVMRFDWIKILIFTTNEIVNHEQNYELPLDHLDRGLRDVVECPIVHVQAVT